MTPLTAPKSSREDALAVARRLREAGHVAYFAGGCVRDMLLDRQPKDWDVATDAPPHHSAATKQLVSQVLVCPGLISSTFAGFDVIFYDVGVDV